MITKHTYTLTYEQVGQRIRDDLTIWRLFGVLTLFTQRREVWRRAALVSDDLRLQVFEADSWQCVYCGYADQKLLTLDHLLPQTQGGNSIASNLRAACRSCNSSKNGRTPEDAGMPLVYGRYLRAAPLELTSTPLPLSARALRVRELLIKQASQSDILADVWGVKGGRHFPQAQQELREIMAQLVGGAA